MQLRMHRMIKLNQSFWHLAHNNCSGSHTLVKKDDDVFFNERKPSTLNKHHKYIQHRQIFNVIIEMHHGKLELSRRELASRKMMHKLSNERNNLLSFSI